jgi:hypothetical protein
MVDKNFVLRELETIGEGSFGKVVKCFDEGRWMFYAVKILKSEKEYLGDLCSEIEV